MGSPLQSILNEITFLSMSKTYSKVEDIGLDKDIYPTYIRNLRLNANNTVAAESRLYNDNKFFILGGLTSIGYVTRRDFYAGYAVIIRDDYQDDPEIQSFKLSNDYIEIKKWLERVNTPYKLCYPDLSMDSIQIPCLATLLEPSA